MACLNESFSDVHTMKKTVLVALFMACVTGSVHAEGLRLSEPVQQDDVSETFGTHIDEWPALTALAEVLDNPDSFMGGSLAIKTEVSKVCQKKGCFFIAQQGKKTIRVVFKDYDFFVPTDIAGREVTLIGEIKKHEVTEAQAKHLSKDLGQQSVIKSGVQYQIIASSVRVPKPSKEG
jgi:hypothetical protein